jgi:hypothetical protein
VPLDLTRSERKRQIIQEMRDAMRRAAKQISMYADHDARQSGRSRSGPVTRTTSHATRSANARALGASRK